MSDVDLQVLLMERAEVVHDFVDRRIPPRLRGTISSEDVLQEVWLAAFRAWADFEPQLGKDSFDRWIITIARNRLLSAMRSARCRKRGTPPAVEAKRSSLLDLYSRVMAHSRTPSSEEAARDSVRAMQLALGDLPDDYQKVITMHHIEGRTHEEVAEAMNRSTASVNSLLYRAMRKLRTHLGSPARYFSDQ